MRLGLSCTIHEENSLGRLLAHILTTTVTNNVMTEMNASCFFASLLLCVLHFLNDPPHVVISCRFLRHSKR